MSKSAGNVIDPFALVDKYGADALRYYLMSSIVTGKDADFSEGRLVERYNADLANSLGNLLNRTLTMVHRYRMGKLTAFKPRWNLLISPRSAELDQEHCRTIFDEVSFAYQSVDEARRARDPSGTNVQSFRLKYPAPWKLAREK